MAACDARFDGVFEKGNIVSAERFGSRGQVVEPEPVCNSIDLAYL
jgi:hypothetical protein